MFDLGVRVSNVGCLVIDIKCQMLGVTHPRNVSRQVLAVDGEVSDFCLKT